VPSRPRRPTAPDAELRDGPAPVTDSDADLKAAEVLPALAEVEDEVAQAELRAEQARARAMELRRQAEAASGDHPDTPEDADEAEPSAATSGRRRLRRLRAGTAGIVARVHRPSRTTVGIGAAIILLSGSLAASGYMVWQHRALVQERKHAAEFLAAARQGTVTIMTIDPDHAKEDFQHMIDSTTGALQGQLRATSLILVKDAQDAKVTTRATVEEAALESMTDHSAVVLVGARSNTTNPDKTQRPPALWRISIEIDRDGGQLKISKFDFIQ
jgi:Mce-associated membrane protein